MALVIGELTRTFAASDKTRCTVSVPIIDDATQEVVGTITDTEAYVEGESAGITAKRFVHEVQQKIDAWLKIRTLNSADVTRDAFLPLLTEQLKLGVK